VIVLLVFVAPFLVGLLLSLLWPHRLGVLGVGVALALLWIVAVYLRAPTSAEEAQCSDCGEYLGRWWEPWLVAMFAVFGLVMWLVGGMTGQAVRRRFIRHESASV
jgi:uncharacterized ion transporter superfamily protein YfcC